MKHLTTILTLLACFISSGCASRAGATSQPAAILNPLTSQPLTLADLQTAEAEIAGILQIASAAGLSNSDTAKAQKVLAPIAKATDAIAANQAGGVPVEAQVLADAAAALAAYRDVKGAIATHPAVVAKVKAAMWKK